MITESFVKKFNLDIIGREQLRIIGIDNIQHQMKEYKITNLPLGNYDKSFNINLHALVVKEIPFIFIYGIGNIAKHVNDTYDISFADPEFMNYKDNIVININILVGADHYFEVVQHREKN